MPYIAGDGASGWRREDLEPANGYEFDGDGRPRTAGELSFKLANQIDMFVEEAGWSYQTANDVVGALDGLKHEFQRRFVDPYEDFKREQNGEVFRHTIRMMDADAKAEQDKASAIWTAKPTVIVDPDVQAGHMYVLNADYMYPPPQQFLPPTYTIQDDRPPPQL